MQKHLYSLLFSFPILVSCTSPLKLESRITAGDLCKRLSSSRYISKHVQAKEEAPSFNYDYQNPNYKSEIEQGAPVKAVFQGVDEIISNNFSSGDPIYDGKEWIKGAVRKVEDIFDFDFKGWEAKIKLDFNSIGFSISRDF